MKSAGALVFGVSKNSLASHEKFKKKYSLPFPLLSDEGHAVAVAYGAFGTKVLYGRPTEGTIRSTYGLGPDAVVQHAWSPVRVPGHVDAVLAALTGGAAVGKVAAKKVAAKKAVKKVVTKAAAKAAKK